MISSIRTFLLVNLLLSVTLSTSIAIIGNIFLEHKEFQTQLDSQLTLAAYTIQSFLDEDSTKEEIMEIQESINQMPNFFVNMHYSPNKQLSNLNTLMNSIQFQVWNKDDELLLYSYLAPKINLSNYKNGFDMIWHNGQPWRIFNINDDKKDISIVVMQRHDFRVTLEKKITEDSITIMIIIYPFLGLLIWLIVGRGLQSITATTSEIKSRGQHKLTPIAVDNVPKEIMPLITELNTLFKSLSNTLFREKRFAANAAHELRTPLAAISAQAQVIRTSKNITTKEEAVKKLIIGVDRCTHVVQQLLTLSRMNPEATALQHKVVNIASIVRQSIAEITPMALKKNISIELICEDKKYLIKGNEVAIDILIRNLVDNAIKYINEGDNIRVIIQKDRQHTILKIFDNGPGVEKKLEARIFERFYRVVGNKASGSGLGLSIVKQITAAHKAKIKIIPNKENETGLKIAIIFINKIS